MIWKIRGREIDCSKTLLMGIVNVTRDSFSDGGQYFDRDRAIRHADNLIEQGADILDLGAESTRPGADPVPQEEELERLLPVLGHLRKTCKIPISIDTTKPGVARQCFQAGADIVNDVSGFGETGAEMAEAVKAFGAGWILMHRRGDPKTMQSLAHYDNPVEEVLRELGESTAKALRTGVMPEQLAVDPGLGFAKTAEQSLELLRHLDRFRDFGLPVVLGHSRKSFIGQWTGREVSEREFGNAAASAFAVLKGVQVLRVHDVAGTRDVVRVAERLRQSDCAAKPG
jgi:dihydropteroate synthase